MASHGGVTEYELKNGPADGISACRFANASDFLLVSSWDKNVRLYDARRNALKLKFEHRAPVLDCCFSADDSKSFSGGIDRALIMCDLTTGARSVLGSHEKPIKSVEFANQLGLVFTGGWDGRVFAWDPRNSKPLVGSTQMPDHAKVYTMHVKEGRMVVGTSNRNVLIYDVRNFAQPEQVRESSLMNQTRCIRIFPDTQGYALSSVEGRVAIEYMDPNPSAQKNKYAFKCHRKTDEASGAQILYPVNALAFHPKYGTFVTGGCDGVINVWDGVNRKRICQYPAYSTSIAYTDFNAAGDLLAIAVSYTFEEGDREHPPDSVVLRTVMDHEVRRKDPRK